MFKSIPNADIQNPFEILGIDPTFEIDLTALDAAYFSRQSLAHPDRFVYHSAPMRQAASSQAALLNQAYECVKDPVLRAKALLVLRGIPIPGEAGQSIQDKGVLSEMMELQESLAEAESPHALKASEEEIQSRLKAIMVSFSAALKDNQVEKGLAFFLRMSYLSKMMGDIKTRRRQLSIKALL